MVKQKINSFFLYYRWTKGISCRARVYTIGDIITPLEEYHTHTHIIHRKDRVAKQRVTKKRVGKKSVTKKQEKDDKEYLDVDYLLI